MKGDLSHLPDVERWTMLIEMFRPLSASYAHGLELLRDAGQDLEELLNDILDQIEQRR